MVHLDETRDDLRLEALLAVACRQRPSKRLLQSVSAAIDNSRRGDYALANLRLAIAGLSRIPVTQDCAVRVATARDLLANGFAASELLKAISIDDGPGDDFAKFDPDQPRVPAGSGSESGRWTNGHQDRGTASSVAIPGAAAIAARGAPILAPTLGAEAIAALSVLAGTVGFAATLGLLFVPSPNNVSSSGPLPGSSGANYSYNQDEGLLRVIDAEGNVLAAGQKDKTGVFYDANTDVPFARYVDGALLFDDDTVKTLTEDTTTAARSAVEDDEKEEEENAPKLCPLQIPDKPGSEAASPRAKAYQEQISFMINPQRALEYGWAMGLINPLTGKLVYYDECDERTGTMIDAKGPGLAGVLSFPQGKDSLTEDWLNQGGNQLAAAGPRNVIWYFAEDSAARYARDLFTSNGLGKIIVKVQPAVWP